MHHADPENARCVYLAIVHFSQNISYVLGPSMDVTSRVCHALARVIMVHWNGLVARSTAGLNCCDMVRAQSPHIPCNNTPHHIWTVCEPPPLHFCARPRLADLEEEMQPTVFKQQCDAFSRNMDYIVFAPRCSSDSGSIVVVAKFNLFSAERRAFESKSVTDTRATTDKNDPFLNVGFKHGKKRVDKNVAKCKMGFGRKTENTLPLPTGRGSPTCTAMARNLKMSGLPHNEFWPFFGPPF